jgi:Fic family protein
MENFMSLIKKIDNIKKQLEDIRPFSYKMLSELKEYFKIGTAYSSNALEGNTLTEGETKIVIEDGLTIAGKPLRDHLEAVGYSDAFEFIYRMSGEEKITETMIKKIHKLFYNRIDMNEAGIYRSRAVFISGTDYVPPQSSKIHKLIDKSLENINGNDAEHPIRKAFNAHLNIALIHPFIDGNGRVARLLMNLILIQHGYYPTYIPPILRGEYIASLKAASERNDKKPFLNFMEERLIASMNELKNLLIKAYRE